ncbi:GAF and ANTAR domain-containing protein [Brachybacterium huguangmaarense]|uniref:GAF and ANTAR domain-containing protein n=1 Tax=Brachybacterium huguangmaarense TaxID=1652028 RepID=A0ABY6G1K4_9MICO|nr:GAF and ANTAR domain-containing protein [Brachybacterium huguangmaarense]UYG17093.1 GAF and ANTAR domain-containing protein [Brachybacterium huguangmaarense]
MSNHPSEPSPSDPLAAPDVAQAFARLHAVMTSGTSAVDATKLLRTCVSLVPNVEHASITLVRRSRPPRSVAATSDVPGLIDALQYEVGEGPCLEAATEDTVVLSEDLAADVRWPRFSARCVHATSISSMLCARLLLADGDSGALNLYATRPHAFADADVTITSVLATFAALALAHELHESDVAGLNTALSSNRQIATAIGILMSRHQLTRDAAFDRLRTASNHLNRKLAELAATVEYTGDLPSSPRPRSARSDDPGADVP